MSTLKIHVVKGVNSYTDDLIKTEQRSINRRREVNFNIGDLNAHQRSSSRTKSFALYKRSNKKRRKSSDREKSEDKEEENDNEEVNEYESTKNEETTSGIPKKEFEPEYKEEVDEQPDDIDDSDNTEIQPDLISIINDTTEAISPKDHGSETDEDPSRAQTDDETNYDADSPKREYQNVFTDKDTLDEAKSVNSDDIGDYTFFSMKGRDDDISVSNSEKDIAVKFKKFTDNIKEKYDKSAFKEMHEKNMKNMRKQFKNLTVKKANKEDSDSEDTYYSEGSEVEYWGAPVETNVTGSTTTPGGFRFNQSRFNSNTLKNKKNLKDLKRCCC